MPHLPVVSYFEIVIPECSPSTPVESWYIYGHCDRETAGWIHGKPGPVHCSGQTQAASIFECLPACHSVRQLLMVTKHLVSVSGSDICLI